MPHEMKRNERGQWVAEHCNIKNKKGEGGWGGQSKGQFHS